MKIEADVIIQILSDMLHLLSPTECDRTNSDAVLFFLGPVLQKRCRLREEAEFCSWGCSECMSQRSEALNPPKWIQLRRGLFGDACGTVCNCVTLIFLAWRL